MLKRIFVSFVIVLMVVITTFILVLDTTDKLEKIVDLQGKNATVCMMGNCVKCKFSILDFCQYTDF
jgi:competence protein ComGC